MPSSQESGVRRPLSRLLRLATCSVSPQPMPMPDVPAIAVDQLVKVYKTTRAVDGVSFALEAGSITGLLGGNGPAGWEAFGRTEDSRGARQSAHQFPPGPPPG